VGIKELTKLSEIFNVVLWSWFLGDGELELGDGAIITRAGLRSRLGAPPERLLQKLASGKEALSADERTYFRIIGMAEPPAGLAIAPDDNAVRLEVRSAGMGGSPKVWAELFAVEATDTERDVAKQLHISSKSLIELSLELWDNRIDAERDKRAGSLDNDTVRQRQARRGHQTRNLIKELRERIAERRRARAQTTRPTKEKKR
jgi:hypothetical protein